MRSLLRPAPSANRHVEHEYRAARAIVERHGEDSLSPFILRPDKALQFAAGGVLSYRVIRGTAIVSSDPVAPGERRPQVLASFLQIARARAAGRWWCGAPRSAISTPTAALGLHAVRAGEEAFVDPRQFTLEGRPVRKLRQSVHRVQRRGWEITVCEGATIDAATRARDRRARVGTGAPASGACTASRWAWASTSQTSARMTCTCSARSPEGRARRRRCASSATADKLSLDTMRRVGETPNGLNEALVCRALEAGARARRQRGQPQLRRAGPPRARRARARSRFRSGAISWSWRSARRFQMERLVRFNEKFAPRVAAALSGLRDARRAAAGGRCECSRPRATSPSCSRPRLPHGRLPLPPAGGAARRTRGAPGERAGAPRGRMTRALAGGARRCWSIGLGGAYSYWESYYQHRGFADGRPGRRRAPGPAGRRSTSTRAALRREADYLAYLPPGYDPAHRRYPVYYLLHGSPGRPQVFVDDRQHGACGWTTWSREHRMRPMILVYPDGRIGGSTYSDSEWANTPSGAYDELRDQRRPRRRSPLRDDRQRAATA